MKTEYLHIGLIQQSDKLGICKAGGAAALAPRTCEGGGKSSAHWYRGEPVIRISFTKAREEEQQTQKDNSI